MPAGFILDEFDVYLSPLATRLIVVIIIIVSVGSDARPFDTAILSTCYAVAVTGRSLVLDGWRLCGVGKVSHSREAMGYSRGVVMKLDQLVMGIKPNEE